MKHVARLVLLTLLWLVICINAVFGQSLPVVDTGWVRCNAEAEHDLTYPSLIAVAPDPCRELVIHTISLQYRYSGTLRTHPNSPAPCYAQGGGGTVIYWTAAQPSTYYHHETGTWGGGGLVYSVQAGGGNWFESCVPPGEERTFVDTTTFWNVQPEQAPCVSQNFPIIGVRRNLPIARLWFTPQYRANGTSWSWGWQYPVPSGSWGTHSPMQYVENPVEARHVFAYEWR